MHSRPVKTSKKHRSHVAAQRVAQGGLMIVAVPVAIVGTLLQALGFVAFAVAEKIGGEAAQ